MGVPVLIIGKSGSGKSTALRNFTPEELGVISVIKKPLPFKNDFKILFSDDYSKIKEVLLKSKTKSVVIDDASYLLVNQFMRGHSSVSKGSSIFDLYNSIGDRFWDLIMYISNSVPDNKIVYIVMHEDKSDYGDIKPKTIGKMLDEKVCVEGMFTIALRAVYEDKKYMFKTHTDGFDITKSPIGMFVEDSIENDLKMVDDTIRKFYNMKEELPKKDEPTASGEGDKK